MNLALLLAPAVATNIDFIPGDAVFHTTHGTQLAQRVMKELSKLGADPDRLIIEGRQLTNNKTGWVAFEVNSQGER